jgi:multidrug efflux pump subunit AcrB
MLARFFIDRPVFAWVISIVIVLAGGAAAYVLPIAQYPEITPPTVQVTCQYPGASARVVAETIAQPIEQEVNGVEKMLYMSSQCNSDGSYSLTVTFQLGTNLDMAQVLVQNRVSLALPRLPDVVKQTGVSTKKRSPAILLVVNLFSKDDPATGKPFFDQLHLSNYATLQIRDRLARIDGVGDVTMLGQQDYSMRVWVDPEKLAARNLGAGDVVKSLREQNVQVAAGRLGQPPVPAGLAFQYSMFTKGRLVQADEFGDIVVKTGDDGQVTHLRDVARVQLGARSEDVASRLDGQPSVGLAIFQLPGSNALAVADRIKAEMKELEKRFPKNLEYAIVYDTTPFIEESVREVYKTLVEAVILVALVVLVFLQDWKSLMLPLIDVGVSLVGTCAVLYAVTLVGDAVNVPALKFSLNNLTLFGLVLAIGIVVDDAIVVLENIERWLEMGHPVREATIGAMGEITGPIIGITLVLSSVFLPSAFLGGISGQFYRQFALTIAASMIISAINAMTMTPARAAAIFGGRKPGHHGDEGKEALPWWGTALLFGYLGWRFAGPWLRPMLAGLPPYADHAILLLPGAVAGLVLFKPVNRALGLFFKGFNRLFNALTVGYGALVRAALRVSVIVLLVYGGLLGLTYFGFTRIPVGFIPEQDKGYLVVNIELPEAASLERTQEVVKKVEQIAKETPGVAHTVSIPGMAIILDSAVASNYGSMFIVLDPFEERRGHDTGGNAIAAKVRQRCSEEIEAARVQVFGPPPVDGLGNAGGVKLMVEDRSNAGLEVLQGQADNLAEKGSQLPGLVVMFNSFNSSTPQLELEIDRQKCKTLQVPLTDVFDTLQVFLGGYYVNDFNRFDRTWQVNVQADAAFRLHPESIRGMKVRNARGEMVPLGAVADVRRVTGPIRVTRYNLYPAAAINGILVPGASTGAVIRDVEALARQELNPSLAAEWTELTLMQKMTGNTAVFAFVGAVVLVFLVLAAQYESWSLPFAVILVVPMCLLSALFGIWLAKMDINIFVQVGFIVLVGLASKNAILIVEFARDRMRQGKPLLEATLDASTTRLRPIVMTSFAFILGVVPLMLAHGAGAEMRTTLGTAVFWGMLGVTLFGVFLTPVFFYVVIGLVGLPSAARSEGPAAAPPAGPPPPGYAESIAIHDRRPGHG